MTPNYRLALPILALLPFGCSSPPPDDALVPVGGKVVQSGEPVAGAFLVFHPVPDQPDLIRPNAATGPDGQFSLTTIADGDGASPGEYVVTATLPASETPTADPETTLEAPDRLEGRFADPLRSTLRVTVDGPTSELLIELDSGTVSGRSRPTPRQ